MVKRIVLFSDGTGNSAASPFKTNVWRVYDALDLSAGADQIAFYDDGVGSSSNTYVAAVTGAVGIGLKRNVLDLYKFVSRQFKRALDEVSAANGGTVEQKDLPKISCFGFSRGAFTIRVLVGLIQTQGLLTRAGEDELDWFARRAYAEFRDEAFHTNLGVEELWRRPWARIAPWLDERMGFPRYDKTKNLQAKGSSALKDGAPAVTIEFLGLWDTVGAYGMPLEEFRQAIDDWIFPLTFADTNLCPMVTRARHALSIDDERDAFTPIPFHDAPQRAQAREERERLGAAGAPDVACRSVQLWFPGVHANVGGGYPDDSLAYEPLRWILDEALDAEAILCRPAAVEAIRQKATAFGKIYDSRAGIDGLYRYKPRDIAGVLRPNADTPAPDNVRDVDYLPLMHESVVKRIIAGYGGYAPIALPQKVAVADAKGRVEYVTQADASGDVNVVPVGPPSDADAGIRRLNPPSIAQKSLVDSAVFWRRVLYQTTIWPLLALLIAPLWSSLPFAPQPAVDPTSALAAFIQWVGDFLPKFAQPWIAAFRAYPITAFSLSILALFSFFWGARLKSLIGDRSRAAWAIDEIDPPQTAVAKWVFDPLGLALMNSPALIRCKTLAVEIAVPLIAIAIAVPIAALLLYAALMVPAVADRLVFGGQSYFGFVCRGGAGDPPPLAGETSFVFDASNPCAPSGVALERGKRYRLTLRMQEDAWLDASHQADLAGLNWRALTFGDKLFYALMTPPFRRVLTEPWFKPVLRVGATGWYNELPVEPDETPRKGAPLRGLTMTFTAPADGEAFLFVNDAYSGILPIGWGETGAIAGYTRHTYANNAGMAAAAIAPAPTEHE